MAETYYVAINGNDGWPGTEQQPFRTIQRGVNAVVAGDTLLIKNGTYVEEINVYFRSIAEREKTLVESMMIPALEKILPCKFDAVEWWPEGKDSEAPQTKDVDDSLSLRGLFKKWFRSN